MIGKNVLKLPLFSFLVFSFWFLVFGLFSGCVTTEYNPATHTQDILMYSTEREIALGQNIANQVAEEMTLSGDQALIDRVSSIGNKIVEICDRKELTYYFYVIDDEKQKDEKNAFSLPGGYVYIYKGLLDDLSDNDELAFILAHEIGHIVSRHAVKRLQAMMGYNLAAISSAIVTRDYQFSQGLSFALAQIITAYSQEDEFNADELAVKYTKETGYDSKAGISVMEKLYKEGKKHISTPDYFRTHPYTAPRIRHIKETLRLPLDVNDYMN